MSSRSGLAAVPFAVPQWGGLIERIARGDTDALAAPYDGTAALVHGLTLRILGDLHIAGRHLHGGDDHRASAGSTHDAPWSDGGCLLLIVEAPA
ncbi:MAG TPA: hypothetical protein VKA21_14675 [Candidatus Binatia bacterium]|nr:hypothetical protein [Candidatus Binatia bacterium]